MKDSHAVVISVLLVLGAPGCEENTAPPTAEFGPPSSVLAQSVNVSTVALSWSVPAGITDTMLAGYIISYDLVRDSIPKTPRQYAAANLLPGVVGFTLQAVSVENEYSGTTAMSWAPAARYDSVFSLYEYDVSHLLQQYSGFNIGSRTTEPSAVPVGIAIQLPFDAYLYGQGGQQLTLRGGQLFNATYDPFLFADRADAASSLDHYIDQFPATFTRGEIVLRDNTIYYARGTGDPGEVHYVRIHVRFEGGSYPNRKVVISLSVQKVPDLQFAHSGPGDGGWTVAASVIPTRS